METGAFYLKPRLSQRIWGWLGFGHARASRPDEDELAEDWAPSWLITNTYVRLDWCDRLRALFSGNLHVEQALKTDVSVERSKATGAVSVLPPRYLRANAKPRAMA